MGLRERRAEIARAAEIQSLRDKIVALQSDLSRERRMRRRVEQEVAEMGARSAPRDGSGAPEVPRPCLRAPELK